MPISSDRLSYFPKTLYTQNSTTFDFVFRNFAYKHRGADDDSHLVLEMTLVHANTTNNGSVTKSFSIDDEYTPSVFQTYNYIFGKSSGTTYDEKGFLQWKPISYLSEERVSTKSQQANFVHGLPMSFSNLTGSGSLATALYNVTNVGNISQMFVVFATSDDAEDGASVYVSW